MKQSPVLVALVLTALGVSPFAAAQTFEEIVPPNAAYSIPLGMRDGKVVGVYQDAVTGHTRGFSFSHGAGYSTFEAPGVDYNVGTWPTGIDAFGRITGYFYTTDYRVRGFVRHANGAIQAFDADYPQPYNTNPYSANGLGAAVGEYRAYGDDFTPRAFARTPLGLILHIQVPGSGLNLASDINDGGTIVGYWGEDLNSDWFAFIRSPLGFYTTYALPDGCRITDGELHHINNRGDVAGTCSVGAFGVSGFIRWRNGTTLKVDYPGSDTTYIRGIAGNGDVAGYYYLPESGVHGFVRKANGAFVSFDAPGSDPGNTYVYRMDERGNTSGTYYKDGGLLQGTYIRYAGSP